MPNKGMKIVSWHEEWEKQRNQCDKFYHKNKELEEKIVEQKNVISDCVDVIDLIYGDKQIYYNDLQDAKARIENAVALCKLKRFVVKSEILEALGVRECKSDGVIERCLEEMDNDDPITRRRGSKGGKTN
jgi:hypothetical protein